jgi:hypothetical protein
MKTCNRCKIKKPLENFYRRKKHYRPECIPCQAISEKIWRTANKDYISNYNRIRSKTMASRYAQVKSHNKLRYNNVNLSFEDYCTLISLDCIYCGIELELSGKGLDRLDSNKGYIVENCVPCCRMCNVIKNEYSLDKLIDHLPKMFKGLVELQERLKDENK